MGSGESGVDYVRKIVVKEASARIGEVIKGLSNIRLTPQDLSSPVALQMAISRIYSALMKTLEEGPKKHYVAEIRFRDDLGNDIVFAVDLGEEPPPFRSNVVKARLLIEIYEDTTDSNA